MPVRLDFKTDPSGLIFWGEGTVTGGELISALQEVYADERYESLRYWVADYSHCEAFHPRTDALKTIVEINKQAAPRNPHLFLALVAAQDSIFGACRQIKPYNETVGINTNIFRAREQAKEWLETELQTTIHDQD